MKHIRRSNRSFAILLILVTSCLSTGCSKYFGNDLNRDVVFVGILNGVQQFPASGEHTDSICVTNDQSCNVNRLDEAYHLVWDGDSFSANYTDVCNTGSNEITTIVIISGSFSADHKTLLSFNGSRRLTKNDPAGFSDMVEQSIELENVPMDLGPESITFFGEGDVAKYIVSAYWNHTTITPSSTSTSETGSLDFSDANTQLTISFIKVY